MNKSDKSMYWYKLRKDFFEQMNIKLLVSEYDARIALFYIQLMCLSIPTLGVIQAVENCPFTPQRLSKLTNTTIYWANKGLQVLSNLDLITLPDKYTIIVNEVQDNLGETSTSRVQKYRAKRANYDMHNSAQGNSDVTFQKRTDIEIETEIDTELDIDGEGDIDSRQSVGDGFVNTPTPIVGGDSRNVSSSSTSAQAQGTVPPTPTVDRSTGRGGVAPSSNTTTVNQASGVISTEVERSRQPALSSQQPQRQASITEGGGTTCRDGRSRQGTSRTLPQSCSASQPSAQVASIALLPALATDVSPAHRLHASRPPGGSLEPPTPTGIGNTGRGNAVQALLKDTARRMDIKTFVPPSYDDVASYIKKKGYTVDPKRFICYYTANGWMISKNPMRNWQAAVDSWQLKEQPSCSQGNYTFNTPRTPPVDRVIVGGVDVERRTYTDEQLESLFCTLEDAENL